MDLDHDPVRPHGNGRQRQRGHEIPFSGGVTRIDDDRQVRQLLQRRDRRKVQRIPGVLFEGPDAPLAEDNIVVSLGHDVLGRHQKLLDRRAHPPLEEDRLAVDAHLLEETEVLHVPGTDLDHVGILHHKLCIPRVHQLADDRQPGHLPHLGQVSQPLLTKALKRIRRGPRLKGPPSEQGGTRLLDLGRRIKQHLAPFDRAWAGNDREPLPAYRYTIDLHDAWLGLEVSTGEFEGRQNGEDLFNGGQGLKRHIPKDPLIPDGPDDGPLHPSGDVGLEAMLGNSLHHLVDVGLGGGRAQDDDHLLLLPSVGPADLAAAATVPSTSARAWRARLFSWGVPTVTRIYVGRPYPSMDRTMTPLRRRASATALPSTPTLTRMKLVTLGMVTSPNASRRDRMVLRPASVIRSVSSRWAESSRAANAAFWANVLTLKGCRTRFRSSTISVEPMPYPIRSPARPYAFEKVLRAKR